MIKKAYFAGGQKTHTFKKGKGIGSVLLNGGLGGPSAGASYSSLEDYFDTTNQTPTFRGSGISKNLGDKLDSLMIKKPKLKKDKNITFNF